MYSINMSTNYLLMGSTKPLQAMRFTPRTEPKAHWIQVAAAGAAIIGSMISAANQPDGMKYPEAEVLPKTVSGSTVQDMDILYDQSAIMNLHDMTNMFKEQAEKNDQFFNDIYVPFQTSMAQANQNMLPVIEKVSGDALEAISNTLMSTEKIRGVFEYQATQGLSEGTRSKLDSFYEQTNAIPTTEQRVGEALTAVESQFSAAGKELARDFQSRGQTVSQASRRDLAFEKAKAKSAAGGLAAEQSRNELLNAKSAAASVSLQADQMDASLKAGAAGVLGQLAATQSQSLQAAQMGLMKVDDISGIESRQAAQEGLGQLAATNYGTRMSTDTIEHTQKDIKTAPVVAGAQGSPGGTVGGVGGVGTGGGTGTGGGGTGDGTGGTGGTGGVGGGGINPSTGGLLDTAATQRTYSDGNYGLGRTVEFAGDFFHVADPIGGYEGGADPSSGRITNLQTGEILDFTGNLPEGDRTWYDTKRFENILRQRATMKGQKSTMFLQADKTYKDYQDAILAPRRNAIANTAGL